MSWISLIAIGCLAGFASGFFGIGGGIILVPCLVYLCHFSQHQAVATSLAIMLPPVTLLAVVEYYRQGWVDVKVACVLVVVMLLSSYLAALVARNLNGHQLRFSFSIFVILAGIYMLIESFLKLKSH